MAEPNSPMTWLTEGLCVQESSSHPKCDLGLTYKYINSRLCRPSIICCSCTLAVVFILRPGGRNEPSHSPAGWLTLKQRLPATFCTWLVTRPCSKCIYCTLYIRYRTLESMVASCTLVTPINPIFDIYLCRTYAPREEVGRSILGRACALTHSSLRVRLGGKARKYSCLTLFAFVPNAKRHRRRGAGPVARGSPPGPFTSVWRCGVVS